MIRAKFLLAILSVLSFYSVLAQDAPPSRPSPTAITSARYKDTYVKITYCQPRKRGREVYGKLVPFGEVWRTGANEATEIEFYQNVKINNVKIKKGRYTLYCIPYIDKWTFILNKETDTWGSFKYDSKKDIVRMDVPVQKQTEITEEFVMAFEKSATGANLIVAWEDVKVNLPIIF